MEAETLKRLALKALTNRQSAPLLVDLHPMLADLATAMANPNRKWPPRLSDWCEGQGLSVESFDALKASLKEANDRTIAQEECERATDAFKRFAERLRGLAYGIDSQLKFGPDFAAEWVRKADLPSLLASLPRLPTPTDLKVG